MRDHHKTGRHQAPEGTLGCISARRAAVLASLALCLIASDVPAGERPVWLDYPPLEAPADALLKDALAHSTDSDQAVLILSRDTVLRFDQDGRQTQTKRVLFRIESSEAIADWARVSAAWSPWHEARPSIRARVITAGGQELPFDPSLLSDSPSASGDPAMFGDGRVLEGPLPGVAVGAVVETLIERRDREPFFAAGNVSQTYLVSTVPIAYASLTLDAPVDLPLAFTLHRAEGIEPVDTRQDGRHTVRITYTDMPAAEEVEGGQPPEAARWPSITLSTAASWQQVARAYAQIVDSHVRGADLSAPASSTAGRTSDSAATSQSQRIDALLATLHENVRYTGLELGAASIVPATPAETLERRFGDCKDQATLLVAMLRREGIPAYVALLNAARGRDVDVDRPGLGLFNHAIVYLPGLRPMWIDPTDPHARAGELPSVDQDRWALIAAPSTKNLIKTPASQPTDNRQIETREVYLPAFGRGRIVETTVYHGVLERQQRAVIESSSASERREGYADYLASAYIEAELGASEELGTKDLSRPLTLRLEALHAARAAVDLDEAVVAIPIANLVANMPDELLSSDAEPREHPFVLVPSQLEWHYRIHPPAGFVPREIPADKERALGVATMQRSFRFEAGVLHADFTFTSGPRRLTPAEFDATRKALSEVGEQNEVLALWLDPEASVLARRGKAVEAIRAARATASAPTASPIDGIRFGQALLSMGLGEAARHQAEHAIEADPERSIAHWFLATTYLKDPIGRAWKPGIDRPAALLSLEKAVALDPGSELAQAELVLALEHNDAGIRQGPGADLEAAVSHMLAFREGFSNHNLDVNLAEALMRTGRGEQLVALAEEMDDATQKAIWGLVGTALAAGEDAVLARASRLSGDLPTRTNRLAQAAQQLVIARQYQTAAALMRQASAGSANPAALNTYIKILEATRPLSEIPEPSEPGQKILYRLLRLVCDDKKVFGTVFHSLVLEDTDTKNLSAALEEGIHRALAGGERGAAQSVPIEVATDLTYAFADVDLDGDPGALQRLRMHARMQLPGVSELGSFYVAPADAEGQGSLRILGREDEAGWILLRLIDRGDLESARRWLDWLREALPDGDSDDPFAEPPLKRLWSSGATSDVERMKQAAASLLAFSDFDALKRRAAQVLAPALAATEPTDPRWKPLAIALLIASPRRGDAQTREREAGHGATVDLDDLTARMLEAASDSDAAFSIRMEVLIEAKHFAAATALARERHEADATDQAAILALAQVAYKTGDLVTADHWFSLLDPDDRENATAFNNQAWRMLFLSSPKPSAAVDLASRSAELSHYKNRGILHTLATAYAANQQPAEAYRVLLQMVKTQHDAVENSDYLVLGRIAQSVGETDAARAYYARVEKDTRTFSSGQLAERWSAGLGTQPSPASTEGR